MKPTVGRIVHFRMGDADCLKVKDQRRIVGGAFGSSKPGNESRPGDILPMTVVRVWADGLINGQVALDGPDHYWATSVRQIQPEDDDVRGWFWPPRE